MAQRSMQEIKLHDTIVKSLENIYLNKKNAESVKTNLSRQDAVIKGLSPDLIAKTHTLLVFKVETESTVTEGRAIEWISFSEKIGQFYLLVPDPLKIEALKIIKKLAIQKIILTTYKIKTNKLIFGNLP